MVYKKKFSDYLFDNTILIALIIISVFAVIPILHVISISFSDKAAVSAGMVTLWPVRPTLVPYSAVFDDKYFFTSFFVSIKRVLLGGTINLVFTIMMAFPLSRSVKKFKSRNIYMWIVVFTMLFNSGLIPWYLTIKNLGLLDSIWALVLPGAVPVFNVIILMNFFRDIPKEIEEAAIIDGTNPLKLLLLIFIPLSMPALATVTLFSIVDHWNEFFDGLILMKSQQNYPLQTYMNQLVIQFSTVMTTMSPEQVAKMMKLSDRTINAAKIIISMIPILLVYPFLQRYLITGLTLGSVKE